MLIGAAHAAELEKYPNCERTAIQNAIRVAVGQMADAENLVTGFGVQVINLDHTQSQAKGSGPTGTVQNDYLAEVYFTMGGADNSDDSIGKVSIQTSYANATSNCIYSGNTITQNPQPITSDDLSAAFVKESDSAQGCSGD